MSFERNDRYFVFKRSDVPESALPVLESLRETADHLRGMKGKPPLVCVVVEQDWPEYETVWDMIEGRVEGEQAERIHRDMVLENNRIAAQSDATYGSDGIMQFDDPYQAMAFLVFGARED